MHIVPRFMQIIKCYNKKVTQKIHREQYNLKYAHAILRVECLRNVGELIQAYLSCSVILYIQSNFSDLKVRFFLTLLT